MASFDENGKYIKTNWKAGDKITATKLNKIEESIEAVNDNDISRHVEADARLDALEAKDVAHDKELTNIKNTIADNKAAAELGDYEINSRMTFLEEELNEGIEEVHNVAETVDGKIATAEANMTTQVNTAKDEMTAQVETAKEEMTTQVNTAKDEMEAMVDEARVEIGQMVHYCNNVEEMKNGNFEIDDTIITLGYYEANDGGEGIYKVTTNNADENGGTLINLNNGLQAMLIIKDNVIKSAQFGAIGSNIDNATKLNSAIKVCESEGFALKIVKKINITSPIYINKYVNIFGDGKKSEISATENMDSVFIIEFKSADTMNYEFSNLSISDITISSTVDAEVCGITFNSVVCIYNRLYNITFMGLKGSCIRFINDGSRYNKNVYSHNITWEKLYSLSCSEFLIQDSINGGTIPWIYGGVIKDVHVEQNSALRNKGCLFDLSGFRNITMSDSIIEGNYHTDIQAILKSDQGMDFDKIYFEMKAQNDAIIENQFDLTGHTYHINNPTNLDSIKFINTVGQLHINVKDSIKLPRDIIRDDSNGKVFINGARMGSWYSGLDESNIIPDPYKSNVVFNNFYAGDIYMQFGEAKEFYNLNKNEFSSGNITHPRVTKYEWGSAPNMEIVDDDIYGKVLKITPTNSHNKVFSGLTVTHPSNYEYLTVAATFKWESENLQLKSTSLPSATRCIYINNNTPVSGEWNTTIGIYKVSDTGNLIRFDWDTNVTYPSTHILYIAELKIFTGTNVGRFGGFNAE